MKRVKKRENFIEIPLKDQLLKKIQSYIATIWNSKVDQNKVNGWLDNFKNIDPDIEDKEKLNMLYLLSKFSFLGDNEVRILLKYLYRDLFKRPIIHKIRKDNDDTLDLSIINEEFKKEFNRTKFVAVGSVSESGAMLMYPFRQENFLQDTDMILQKEIFQNIKDINGAVEKIINDTTITRYVFVDDFIGSGVQGKDKLKKDIKLLKDINPKIEIDYYVLVATEDGLKSLKEIDHINSVEAVFILDCTFKVFDTNSRYYKNSDSKIDIAFSKEVAFNYGNILLPYQAFGFGDCQLLLSFYHNTPDNTLPIFWSEENSWKHIFKRFVKNPII